MQLSPEDIKLLEEPYKPHRVLGHYEADLKVRSDATLKIPTTDD